MKQDIDSSFRTVALRASALVGSKAVQDSLLSLLFIWLARIDQSGYGSVLFGLSIVALLRSLQSLGIDQLTLRELSSTSRSSSPFMRQMALIKIVIGLSFFLFFLTFSFHRGWPYHLTVVISTLIIGQFLEGIADTFFNIFRAEGKSIKEGLSRTAPNIISAAYGAICLYFHLDIIYFSLLFLLSGLLKLILAIIGSRRLHDAVLPEKDTVLPLSKMMLKSFAIFSLSSFMGIFYNEIQVFWIKQYHTLIDIAIYRSAFDIAAFVCGIVANLIIGAVLFPLLSKAFSEKNSNKVKWMIRVYFKKIISIGSGAAFFLAVFGGKIVYLVYGEKYLAAMPLAPLFGIAAFFSFINNFIVHIMLAAKREKQLMLFLLFPVAISIGLGPILISAHGAIGAAFSLLLVRVFFSIILITTVQTRFRFLTASDYTNVAVGWLIALILLGFLLFLGVNSSTSCGLALCAYYTVAWLGRNGSWDFYQRLPR